MNAVDVKNILKEGDIKYFLKINENENTGKEIVFTTISLKDEDLVLASNILVKNNDEWEPKSTSFTKIDEEYDLTFVMVGVDYLVKLVRTKMDNQNIKHIILENAKFTPIMLTSMKDRIANITNNK